MKSRDKTVIDKFILFALSKLNQWNLYRVKKYNISTVDNPNNYEVLLPNVDSDEKDYYSEPLKVALNTPNVNSIAITGPYGSGKSSFLESFKKKNAEWSYLPISLATFKNQEEETEDIEQENPNTSSSPTEDKSKFELHQDIERSILQQFFYRERDDDVQYSRFKKIHNIKKKLIWIHTLLVSFVVFYSFLIYRPEKFKKLFLLNPLELLDTNYHKYLTIVFVGITIFYLYKLFHYLQNIQISKFNFKKGEISLAKQDKASILNEHLDEILYFFEVTSYNIVFFEDIDRFDDTEIFIKLRELNNLINNSKQINRRIVFVYAIRDNMFIDKERTKFFDFILPIIPYINPSNSEMKLLEKFKQEIKDKKIDETFLSQVSLYIDDMRLLLNIYNEYMVYKKNLDSDKLKHTHILALIICKNFYPLEFAKLHTREGIIYNLFANKPKYVKEKIEEYMKKKKKIKEHIEHVREENIKNIDELKMIYLGRLFSETNSDVITINDYEEQTLTDLLASDIFENINTNSTCQGFTKEVRRNYNDRYFIGFKNTKSITFGEIEKSIDSNFTYLERKKFVENKSNKKIDELKKEIENLNKKITKLKQATLKQLFETSSHIIIKGYEDKKLLIFLVRNGYIDEYYEHYISYFHKGGITQDDREFLLSIQNYDALDFTFRLKNISKLIEKLQDRNFEQIEILNFDLINFLLENHQVQENKVNLYFTQISNGSKISIKFIFAYLEYASNRDTKAFIQRLEWNELWHYIVDNFSDEKQDKYFKLIFNALYSDEIIALNIDNSLKKYLEKQTILPTYQEDQNQKCKNLMSELELRFSNIQNPSSNEELFEYIYENWHYELSETMIQIMLNEKANGNIDNLNNAHFTTIKRSEAEELISYIESYIDDYVENIFLVIASNTKESEESVLYLLNNNKITSENKIKIIQKEEVRISNINDIEDKELWIELFVDNKIEASWDNVMSYYLNQNSLDDTLISYLNIEENSLELSKVKIDKSYCEENTNFNTQILRDIIESRKVDITSYETLIRNIDYDYNDLDISNLDEEKIILLLKYGRFQFKSECFDMLKEHTHKEHITLIENFKDEFIERFNEFEIDEGDLVLLIESNEFNTEEKFSFIEKSNLSNIEDKKTAKEKISKFYIDNSQYIEDIDLFDKLFYGENKYDLELLILEIPFLDDCDSCRQYLSKFSGDLDKIVEINAKHLYIENNRLNDKLLQELKNKGCISSFSKENSLLHKNKLKVNRKRT